MEALGHTVDLLKSGIGNLTMDDVDDLQMKIEKKKNEYNIIDKKSPGDIWLGDLADFIKEYMIHYPSG
jgi:hypothetical protein